jgi:alkylhydroperoxidase/carboxymuconolactone decarboxylase family protein
VAGYYHQEDLDRFPEIGKNAPELWKKFSEWYGAVFAEGALSEREKCLIALAVAHAVECPYCIDAYTNAALEKGSNLEQMTEAVHVAAAIRGGAALVHGVQMRNAAASSRRWEVPIGRGPAPRSFNSTLGSCATRRAGIVTSMPVRTAAK